MSFVAARHRLASLNPQKLTTRFGSLTSTGAAADSSCVQAPLPRFFRVSSVSPTSASSSSYRLSSGSSTPPPAWTAWRTENGDDDGRRCMNKAVVFGFTEYGCGAIFSSRRRAAFESFHPTVGGGPLCRAFHASSVAANKDDRERAPAGNDVSSSTAPGDEPASSATTKAAAAEAVDKPETLFQRFKSMAKKYWYILIPVHIVTTGFWVGGFYLLAKSGLDLEGILERLGAPDVLMNPVRNSNAGYYAITYACYKLVTPLRYVVTIGGTTVLVQYLTRFGYLKPMPSRSELIKMYSEGKDNFARRQKAWRNRLEDLNWRLKVKEKLKEKRKQQRD